MDTNPLGWGANIEEVIEQFMEGLEDIKRPVTLEDLVHLPRGLRVTKDRKYTQIYGAAHESENRIPTSKLKLMTDPYSSTTRKEFTNCVYTDPILSPATERRHDAFMENGYDLQLELKSKFKPDGTQLTPEETKSAFTDAETKYLSILQRIRSWDDNLNNIEVMKSANTASFVQGRTAAYIIPGFADLGTNELPFNIEIVNQEDLQEPIIDVGLTHKIVGVKVTFSNKKFLRTDELIYIKRRGWGLRKDSWGYGSSAMEPILTISKTIKRIYNWDIPEAVIAAHVTKIIFRMQQPAGSGTSKSRMEDLLKDFLTTGKLAFAVSQEILEIKEIPIKVDSAMLDTNEKKLADIEMGVVGVPKSMLNREHNLNRDIATIQAIQFVKWVQKPDQNLIGEAFENQLYNPLLAHLAGQNFAEIPVRIRVVPIPPEKEEMGDDLATKKSEEITKGELKQDDSKDNVFGAATVEETIAIAKIARKSKKKLLELHLRRQKRNLLN